MPPKTDRLPFTVPSWLRPLFVLPIFGARRTGGKQPGQGVARATARLAEHRKTFAQVTPTPTPSRQQRRAEERAFMKKVRSADKAEALRSGALGGAAACR
jgi:hypothetical protein